MCDLQIEELAYPLEVLAEEPCLVVHELMLLVKRGDILLSAAMNNAEHRRHRMFSCTGGLLKHLEISMCLLFCFFFIALSISSFHPFLEFEYKLFHVFKTANIWLSA